MQPTFVAAGTAAAGQRAPIGPYKRQSEHSQRPGMSALANHAFVKMNGIGNEIVVVDLRAGGQPVTADEWKLVCGMGVLKN